jgi:hypothetical protein
MKIECSSGVLTTRVRLRRSGNRKLIIYAFAASLALMARLPQAEPPAKADPLMLPFFERLRSKQAKIAAARGIAERFVAKAQISLRLAIGARS